jgi:hypothetical protein
MSIFEILIHWYPEKFERIANRRKTVRNLKSIFSNALAKMLTVGTFVPALCAIMTINNPSQVNAGEVCKKFEGVSVKHALRLLSEEVYCFGEPRVCDGILYFGDTAANGNFGLIDSIACRTGYIASIFVASPTGQPPLTSQFIRVVTNLAENNTASAIATILDPTGAAYRAVSRGKDFFGVVRLFGNNFDSGYTPIFDGRGNILGVLFVGRPVIDCSCR